MQETIKYSCQDVKVVWCKNPKGVKEDDNLIKKTAFLL